MTGGKGCPPTTEIYCVQQFEKGFGPYKKKKKKRWPERVQLSSPADQFQVFFFFSNKEKIQQTWERD